VKKYKVKGVVVDSDNTISPYGKDIESELTKILSEQLASEIDRDILRSLGLEPDRNKRRKKSINKIYKNVC
jgi:predicted HAD superfamily phosphohydrolase YqeG